MILENIKAALESILLRLRKGLKSANKTSPNPAIPAGGLANPSTIITVDAAFTPAQRQEIEDAMRVIFDLFGGADRFHAATGMQNLRFIHTTRLPLTTGNAVASYVGNGIIEMTERAFNPAPLVQGWYVAHEVGHAFDFSRSGGKPWLYRSQAFVEHYVPKNRLRRWLGLPIKEVASYVGYQGKAWAETVKNTGTTIRGQLNSAEDFADTFAVVYADATTHSGLPYRSFNSRWRFNKVKEMIRGTP
jgi:hypothetical protein